MTNVIKKIIEPMTGIINWFLGVILTLMLIITFIQVVLRYVFNNPFIWAEEVTLVMLIWYGYIIIALLVKEDKHISLEFLYLKFNTNIRNFLDVIRNFLILSFSILMIYYGMEMVGNAEGKYLPASHIPRSMLSIPLIISGLLITLYTVNHLIILLFPSAGKEVGNRK